MCGCPIKFNNAGLRCVQNIIFIIWTYLALISYLTEDNYYFDIIYIIYSILCLMIHLFGERMMNYIKIRGMKRRLAESMNNELNQTVGYSEI